MTTGDKIENSDFLEFTLAAQWWGKNMKDAPHENVFLFMKSLIVRLYERCKDHWYPDDPSRGSGYRAIVNDYYVDSILIEACRDAKIHPNRLPGQIVQIISPGIVRVRSMNNDKEEIIYKKNYKVSKKCKKIKYFILLMQNQNVYYENGKKYSRSGILPFIPSRIANEISNEINNLLRQSRGSIKKEGWNELTCVLPVNFSNQVENWVNKIDQGDLEYLDKYIRDNYDDEISKKILSSPLKPYCLLEELLRLINDNFPLERINLDSIIGIEPGKTDTENNTQNFYNFFGGRFDNKLDKNIRDTAIRETREEGLIKFHNEIFNLNYQRRIREKLGLEHLPMNIEYCVNKTSKKNHRSYILVMDENIDYSIEKDDNGLYILVKLKDSKNRMFTRVGVLPFLKPPKAKELAQIIDSFNCVKINRVIYNIKNKVNNLQDTNIAAVTSSSVFSNENCWYQKLHNEQVDRVRRLAEVELKDENKNLANDKYIRNIALGNLIEELKKILPNHSEISQGWDNILTVEPVRQKFVMKQKRNNFGYFTGNISNDDSSILEIAKKVTQEACLSIDDSILSQEYQTNIRSSNNVNIPLTIDIPYTDKNNTTYYTKVFLVFMDNIKFTAKAKEKGIICNVSSI